MQQPSPIRGCQRSEAKATAALEWLPPVPGDFPGDDCSCCKCGSTAARLNSANKLACLCERILGPSQAASRGGSDHLPRKVNSACEHAGASAPRARGRAGCRCASDSAVARAAAYLTRSRGITRHRVASCRLMMHVCRRRCRLSMGDGAAAGTRAASKSLRVLDVCAWGAYSVCDCRVLGGMAEWRSEAVILGPSQAASEVAPISCPEK